MSAQSEPDQGASEVRWTMTDRGFKHYAPVESARGGSVLVYESSSAEAPHLWLGTDNASTTTHLTLEQAEQLRDTLTVAIQRHYQMPQPDPADWKAGDPCAMCGSTDTGEENGDAFCRSCGVDDRSGASDEEQAS